MIRVRHETLPAGLSAVVQRRAGGDTDIVVSTMLTAARQRAAVRVGLRAARPAGQRTALPVPLLGVLALAWASGRAVVKGIHIHAAALLAAAGVVTAAVVVIAVIPHQHGTTRGGHSAAGGVPAAAPVPGQTARRPAPSTQPGTGPPPVRPSPSVVPVADRSAGPVGGGPAASPGTSAPGSGAVQPSPTTPAPQPSPSPSGHGGGGLCVDLLGIRLCL